MLLQLDSLEEKPDYYVWWNGQILPWSQAKIHMSTHSLHYGGAIFEGVRTYNSKAYKLLEHCERLHRSANALGLNIPHTPEELIIATNKLIELNKLSYAYIRHFAWRGGEKLGINGESCKHHTAILAYEAFSPEPKLKPLRLEIADWKKQSSISFPSQCKAAALYGIATLIKNTATSRGFDDAIVLDLENNITEATSSNFFFIKQNALYTPIADCFLNGITRQTVLNEIAPSLSIKVFEGKFQLQDLIEAEAAFLTGTAAGIIPVISIFDAKENREFAFNPRNKLLLQIIEKYDELVMAAI